MIKLEQDNSIISVDWSHIENLSGFTKLLHCNKNEISVQVIGQYERKTINKCGLTGCRTRHNKGFIIKTKENQITNVGIVCGKKYFGAQFKDQSKNIKRKIKRQINIELINDFIKNIPIYRKEINSYALKISKGWSWVLELKKRILSDKYTQKIIVESLKNCINSKNPELTIEQDNDLVRIGYLQGLDVFYQNNDITELVRIEVQQNLKRIEPLNPENLKESELKKWAKWIDEFNTKLIRIKNVVKLGRLFFSNDNLNSFKGLFSKKEINNFNKWFIEFERESNEIAS